LDSEPDNVNALNNLGVLYFKKESYDDALRYLSKATEADPGRDYVHNNLGMLYSEMGMHEEAKAEFEKAISLGVNPEEEASNTEQ
jgi:tetratricopeptide (TPR) repeat protein